MGPYRTNAAPLRARREELRLEREEIEAKMAELSAARDDVERAIDDIDLKLQCGHRRARRRPEARLRVLSLGFAGALTIAALLTFAAAIRLW